MNDKIKSKYLRGSEMAEMIPVKERTLRLWRANKVIPFVKIRHVILYDPDAVFAALAKFERLAI
jgi:hypothetical protein